MEGMVPATNSSFAILRSTAMVKNIPHFSMHATMSFIDLTSCSGRQRRNIAMDGCLTKIRNPSVVSLFLIVISYKVSTLLSTIFYFCGIHLLVEQGNIDIWYIPVSLLVFLDYHTFLDKLTISN